MDSQVDSQEDFYLKVQRAGVVDPEKVTHQPQTYRVLAAVGDWIALQTFGGAVVYFQRSMGLQSNQSFRIVEGIEQVPDNFFATWLSEPRKQSIALRLQHLNVNQDVNQKENKKEKQMSQVSQDELNEIRKKIAEREKFVVFGYKDGTVEALEGQAYHLLLEAGDLPAEFKMYSEENPGGCVWFRSIDKSPACPNAATAVAHAIYDTIASDALSEILTTYLIENGWSLSEGMMDGVESLDRLAVRCGSTSVFEGRERTQGLYNNIEYQET